MMKIEEMIRFYRGKKAVRREINRKRWFEESLAKAQKELTMDMMPEDLDGTVYWNLKEAYRDCMNNEYKETHLHGKGLQYYLFDDRKEMEIAARCRVSCELLRERDERINGLTTRRIHAIYA